MSDINIPFIATIILIFIVVTITTFVKRNIVNSRPYQLYWDICMRISNNGKIRISGKEVSEIFSSYIKLFMRNKDLRDEVNRLTLSDPFWEISDLDEIYQKYKEDEDKT